MTANPTSLLNQTLALGDNPDDIEFFVQNGQAFIALGAIHIALSLSSQTALDKLATATAKAAAHQRAHTLRQVA